MAGPSTLPMAMLCIDTYGILTLGQCVAGYILLLLVVVGVILGLVSLFSRKP